jgi:hypothetical protein
VFLSEERPGRIAPSPKLSQSQTVKKQLHLNQTCDLAGAGVNQAAGRQLAIAFLDNRLTDGSDDISLSRRPPVTPRDDVWDSYLSEGESTPGP